MIAPHRRFVARTLQAIVLAVAVAAGCGGGLAATDAGNEARALALGQSVSQAVRPQAPTLSGVRLAVLTEENISPPVSVASPSPTPGAAAEAVPPAGAAPSPTPEAAAVVAAPVAAAPSPTASPPAVGLSAAPIGAQPTPMGTEVPPTLDMTGALATVQVSDASLVTEFGTSANPARAASIRTVERARQDIIAGRADDAIRLLASALSIDPTNPYAYFYLGRAYLIKKNYNQALTFFQRAEIGFTSNPAWLGECLGFEGVAYEETGRVVEAGSAYRRALQAAPNNRIALTGYGRLAASGYTALTDAALRGGPAPPPPANGWAVLPAPAEPPPPPPPAEPPPPVD